MLSLIIIGSLATAAGIISILAKSSPKLMKRMLGYEIALDLSLSILVSLYVALSGTISGMVIGAFTGLFVGATLFVAARMIGYSKFQKGEWVDYPGRWNKESFKAFWEEKTARFSREGQYGFIN